MLRVFCDGGARGNPGPAAAAFVVYKDSQVIFSFSKYLGVATNNVAEYNALILALSYLFKNKQNTFVKIILDSELVTNQMNGKYKVKNVNLKKLFLKAKDLEKKIGIKIYYEWLARLNNKLADSLVNQELDKHKR